MLLRTVSRSPILAEFTPAEQEDFFGVTDKKVIHRIDSLYYVAYLKETLNASGVKQMIEFLRDLREGYDPAADPVEVEGLLYRPFNYKNIYRHCLALDGNFEIYVAESVPNPDTPRFVVMLRSIGLWTYGDKAMVEKSFGFLQRLVKRFALPFDRIVENRIDWCYHTNAIQNPTQFFADNKLKKHCKSRMSQYQKIGRIGKDITIDYFSLGKKQSNNIFFRFYDKTREVVEKGYKAIFIKVWLENRLISKYDAFVLETAYEFKSFSSGVAIGRIDWYLKYGKVAERKEWLMDLRQKYLITSENVAALDKQLDSYLPPITRICNIEYQTMRKFFYSFRNAVEKLDCSVDVDSPFYHIYRVLDNRRLYLDVLTTDVVAFAKDRAVRKRDIEYQAWWKRIQSCKVNGFTDGELYRIYQRNADVKNLLQGIASKVASLGAVRGSDGNFAADVSDGLALFNDNDMHAYFMGCDMDTGEVSKKVAVVADYRNYDVLMARKRRQYKFLSDDSEKAPSPQEDA